MVEDRWGEVREVASGSEGDVETRVILPLLRALGWEPDEIHSKVPVHFRTGRKAGRGRKPEADFAVAEPEPKPPKLAHIVVEAKKPGEPLADAASQAFSYCFALRAPFYLVSDGVHLEIWRNVPYQREERILEVLVKDLSSRRGELEAILGREPVRGYIRSHAPGRLDVAGIDVGEYLSWVSRRLSPGDLVRRVAVGGAGKVAFSPDRKPEIQVASYYVAGESGRGKSSVLDIIEVAVLDGRFGDGRVPIRVSGRELDGNLFERIAGRVSPFAPSLATPDAVEAWLRRIPSALLIDDWHEFADGDRRRIEAALKALDGSDCLAVIAGSRSVPLPDLPNISILSLERFDRNEAVSFVGALIDQRRGIGAAQYLVDAAERALGPLTGEPFALAKFVEATTLRPTGGLQPPTNIGEILRDLLAWSAQRSGVAVDEVAAVLGPLARTARAMDLDAVAARLTACKVTSSASSFCSTLCFAGVLEQTLPGQFQFTHEIFRAYLQALEELKRGEAALAAWAQSLNYRHLVLVAPMIASMIRDPDVQAELLNALVRADARAYLAAVSCRASLELPDDETLADRFLHELYEGYVGFFDAQLPDLKHAALPWAGSPVGSDGHMRTKPVLLGFASPAMAWFTFGLGLETDGQVVSGEAAQEAVVRAGGPYAIRPMETHTSNLSLLGLRPDSGRLVGTRHAFQALENLLRTLSFARVRWIAFEKAAACMSLAASAMQFPDGWESKTIEELGALAAEKGVEEVDLSPYGGEGSVQRELEFRIGRDLISTSTLRAWLMTLENGGWGKSAWASLGLPGPDLIAPSGTPSEFGYAPSAFFSPERRRERMQALFDATRETYREVCEQYLMPLALEFLYADGPFRYIVTVAKTDQPGVWPVSYFREGAEEWTEPSEVLLVDPELGMPLVNSDAVASRIVKRTRALGTAASRVQRGSSTSRLWERGEPCVTDLVRELLLDDLKQLRKYLSAAN